MEVVKVIIMTIKRMDRNIDDDAVVQKEVVLVVVMVDGITDLFEGIVIIIIKVEETLEFLFRKCSSMVQQ